jgi:TRAP-type mannitol/chloroaromatic compound transport system substrate-binding protein
MRIPGLGGEVLQRAGGTPITLPGAEIFTSLQTGAIDATEWVGPYNDVAFGLHKVAKYYYYPGWHEPGPSLEAIINAEAWASLPPDLQAIVETTCQAITMDVTADYTYNNAIALEQLLQNPDIELRRFPDDVLELLRSITREIVDEMTAADPTTARIAESYYGFLEKSTHNQRISDQAYLNTREG